MLDERNLIAGLKEGNREAFSLLFRAYYKDLVLFGGNFLPGDRAACEDVVQSVFLRLWNDRRLAAVDTSLKSYLLKAVRNGCLDELRHRDVVHEHVSYVQATRTADELDTENYILYSDLQRHLLQALEKIPASCREAFEMNRFDGLKYREIADRLRVSERTVEVRISKAVGMLKTLMKEFLTVAVPILISVIKMW
ncbi:MAG: RNA polymerase sigma-70 factor [Tannerella sp.]|nr:RNA polymerase sigma-70 factor [Tannerella sp.]